MFRFALLLALSTAACGGAVQSIEMKGNEPDLAAIAGSWQGKYQAVETGRSGPIQFSLELGRHTADGQVTMGGSKMALKVSFVAVKHDTISGSMEPYTEPTCSCQVQTQFTGTLRGNEIDGTFTTKLLATGNELHGTWQVDRGAIADGS
jgi:hypothetical protein